MGYRSRHKIVISTSKNVLAVAASGPFSGEVLCWMGLICNLDTKPWEFSKQQEADKWNVSCKTKD